MGFSPSAALAEVREFKLARATETRNTCPYCAVACGIIMYGLGDAAKNAKASIIPHRGRPGSPGESRHLCPKGAGLIDFVHSPSRLRYPEYRGAGIGSLAADLLGRCARSHREAHEGRTATPISSRKTPEGLTVNRWLSTAMLAASASSNEVGYLTHKVMRSFGVLSFDNQARV